MFQGSMVALVTPMADDGRIDFAALEELVHWHIAEGTDAIVAVGTTGESATLEADEHMRVIDHCLRAAAGRIPIIAGTGASSTSHALALTRLAQSRGAAAALVVVPYYNKPTQEGLYKHFSTIAQSVSLPLILYNVPSRSVVDMLPDTVQRLSMIPNIIGIKEATGKLERLQELRQRCRAEFLLISGDDATAMEFMLQGGQGVISVSANIAPKIMHAMSIAATTGKRKQAEILNQRLMLLHEHLFLESSPIPVKWALKEMGRIPAGIRLPLTTLAPIHHDKLRATLRSVSAL
jgi:4-hydroxy-tetrahydrodipicolinate synthase